MVPATGGEARYQVVIAGTGIAGLEAALALSELAADRVEIELLSPAREFVYRPMLVTEPFGTATALRLTVKAIAEQIGARHRREALVAVDPGARTVVTGEGTRVPYDALLIALGARPVSAVPGAVTFDPERGDGAIEAVLRQLGTRALRRLAYVVPAQPSWTLAAYELALMTAAERDARRIPTLELTLVTAETEPLALFGDAASRMVRSTLEHEGVNLLTGARPERFVGGRLQLADGELEVDQVVSLPALTVPELAGIPRRRSGFIGTDVTMRVDGLEHVWAAGDATSFPIKHGGIAAQQADVAARSIAVRAGASVRQESFRPVLRGALITGRAPELFEAEVDERGSGVASRAQPLWRPSTKLAARHLSPFLARALGAADPGHDLLDLPPPLDPDDVDEYERGIALVVAAADADAEREDYEGALKWLALVEQLDLALPARYLTRRERWRHELDPSASAHPAAGRIDPTFVSAEQALSDLRRREGWAREAEARQGAEMAAALAALERRIDAVARRSGSPNGS